MHYLCLCSEGRLRNGGAASVGVGRVVCDESMTPRRPALKATSRGPPACITAAGRMRLEACLADFLDFARTDAAGAYVHPDMAPMGTDSLDVLKIRF